MRKNIRVLWFFLCLHFYFSVLQSYTKEKMFRHGNVMINVILFFIQRQILAVFEERLQAVVISDDSVLQKYHKVSS